MIQFYSFGLLASRVPWAMKYSRFLFSRSAASDCQCQSTAQKRMWVSPGVCKAQQHKASPPPPYPTFLSQPNGPDSGDGCVSWDCDAARICMDIMRPAAVNLGRSGRLPATGWKTLASPSASALDSLSQRCGQGLRVGSLVNCLLRGCRRKLTPRESNRHVCLSVHIWGHGLGRGPAVVVRHQHARLSLSRCPTENP